MNQLRINEAERARASGINRRLVLAGMGAGAATAFLAARGPGAQHGAAQESSPAAGTGHFLVMRRYQLAPGAEIAEVVRRTEAGFVPIVREVSGFVEYLNIDLGNGEGATIGLFENQVGAEESTELAAAWVPENLAELMAGPPEVIEGPVLLRVTAEATAGATASVGANREVVRQLLAAFNQGELTTLDEIIAPGFVDHTPLPGMSPDREGIKQAVAEFRSSFPDARWTAEELVSDGDMVVARLVFRGTHQGDFHGIEPTGRSVSVSGIAIYRIVDGLIAEEWAVRDLLGLFQQLGAEIAPG